MDRGIPRIPPSTDTPLLLSRSSDGQHFLRALRICLELQTCQTDEEWGDGLAAQRLVVVGLQKSYEIILALCRIYFDDRGDRKARDV